MGCRARMLACVTIGRRVTAVGEPAGLARAEMHPGRSDFHALDAFTLVRVLYVVDRLEVRARLVSHDQLRSSSTRCLGEGSRRSCRSPRQMMLCSLLALSFLSRTL